MGITNKRLRITRDGVLFVVGVLGIAHETLIAQTDRPTLLLLFAAMVGLPAFLNKDEKRQEQDKDKEDGGDRREPADRP